LNYFQLEVFHAENLWSTLQQQTRQTYTTQ
jgi:hypothetical protein